MEGGATRYSGTRCTFLLKVFNMRVTGPGGGAGDMPPGERNGLRTDELESLTEEVVVVFPLPTEDPLIEERRVHALASALGGASQTSKKGALFTSKDGDKRVSVVQDDLWQVRASEERTVLEANGVRSEATKTATSQTPSPSRLTPPPLSLVAEREARRLEELRR